MNIEIPYDSEHQLVQFELAFANANESLMLTYLNQDVEWLIKGVGLYKGEAVIQHMMKFYNHPIETLIIESVVTNNNRVVISGVSIDSKENKLSFVNIYHYDDNKIKRITSYYINIL